jgi:DHA2 family multidrug resistance protein
MRRVMLTALSGFVVVSVLSALADSLPELLVLRVVSGLFGGFFGPLSFTMILRTFSDRGRHEGLAGLSFAVLGPIAVAGILAGWAQDMGDWRLVFWVQGFLGAVVLGMAFVGIPATSGDPGMLRRLDWRGSALFAVGFAALVLMLNQGERHFWFDSGVIVAAAMVAGPVLTLFVLSAVRSERPAVDLLLLLRRPNFGGAMFFNLFFRFGILVTAFVGAQFLVRVQGYSMVEVAQILPWIAVPQLVTFPLVYYVVKRIDPRITLTLSFGLFAIAAWINANLTGEWAADQYRLSLLILSLAEPLFMISMVYEGVYGIRPSEGPSATTLFNLTRSLGEASGIALLATLITEREKFHSNVMTERLSALTGETLERYEALRARLLELHADPDLAGLQAMARLGAVVRREAYVMAHSDAFLVLVGIMLAAMVLSLLLPKVPDITAGLTPRERAGARP